MDEGVTADGGMVVVLDDSFLLIVVAVVAVIVGRTVEEVEGVEGPVVVLAKLVVVGLRVVVGTNVTDEGKVVVVSNGGSVVDGDRLVVEQC